jgi:hypothetical protein
MAYVAAALVTAWGLAHAAPTRRVVAGFGPIGADNRLVIAQEWLAEAFTMWGIAAIVIAATAAGGAVTDVRDWVYRVAAALLAALGVLTAATGARTSVLWFKVCPVVMAAAAVLLLAASTGEGRCQVCSTADRASRAEGTSV